MLIASTPLMGWYTHTHTDIVCKKRWVNEWMRVDFTIRTGVGSSRAARGGCSIIATLFWVNEVVVECVALTLSVTHTNKRCFSILPSYSLSFLLSYFLHDRTITREGVREERPPKKRIVMNPFPYSFQPFVQLIETREKERERETLSTRERGRMHTPPG